MSNFSVHPTEKDYNAEIYCKDEKYEILPFSPNHISQKKNHKHKQTQHTFYFREISFIIQSVCHKIQIKCNMLFYSSSRFFCYMQHGLAAKPAKNQGIMFTQNIETQNCSLTPTKQPQKDHLMLTLYFLGVWCIFNPFKTHRAGDK